MESSSISASDMNMHEIKRSVIVFLYDMLHKLKLKGVVCSIGSTSFNDIKVSIVNGAVYISDLDLIVILTPFSYLKYLVLKKFSKNIKIHTKIYVKEFKSSISYMNPYASWLLGNVNYINLLELRIIDPKTASLGKWVTTTMNVPLLNVLELFASCLADLVCVSVVNNDIRRSAIVRKRLRFLGYIYCLVNHLDIINRFRDRSRCFELLKSNKNDLGMIETDENIGLLIRLFVDTFAGHVLSKNESIINSSRQEAVENIIRTYYSMVIAKRPFYKFLTLIKCLYKNDPTELRLFIRHGLELTEFLRLMVFLIVKKIIEAGSINPSMVRNFCHLWTKYIE